MVDPKLTARVAAKLIAAKQTLAVSESSAGGLISAALLSVPGASAYYIGGGIIYTAAAREALMGVTKESITGMRSATLGMSVLLAETARTRLGADWGLGETGATGPAGNRYGDAAGHCCLAVTGPFPMTQLLETGSSDRAANMLAFATAALVLLEAALDVA